MATMVATTTKYEMSPCGKTMGSLGFAAHCRFECETCRAWWLARVTAREEATR